MTAMASSDDFYRKLRLVPPVARPPTHLRRLYAQVVDDVAEVAAEAQEKVNRDLRVQLWSALSEGEEPLPEFVPDPSKRLCSGCGRMRKLERFDGSTTRCRGCGP